MDKYTTLRILIDTGAVTSLRQILDYMPAEILAKDLKDDPGRLIDLFFNTKDITMNEINALAELVDCDFEQMARLVVNQHLADMKNG